MKQTDRQVLDPYILGTCYPIERIRYHQSHRYEPHAIIEKLDYAQALHRAISSLPGRLRFIIVRLYGLDGCQPYTLAQLGVIMDMRRQSVHAMACDARNRLRKVMKV
jgi:DNA-directed RNA polymerase sigma subunit (sigma70/sigma32)